MQHLHIKTKHSKCVEYGQFGCQHSCNSVSSLLKSIYNMYSYFNKFSSNFQTKKKRKRCGECIGCQKKDNCGDCAPCRNDKSHQICKQRRCEKLTDKKVCGRQNINWLLRVLSSGNICIQIKIEKQNSLRGISRLFLLKRLNQTNKGELLWGRNSKFVNSTRRQIIIDCKLQAIPTKKERKM